MSWQFWKTDTCAILIMDLVGFSSLCEKEGIGAGIDHINQFFEIAKQEVSRNAGTFIKTWGDDFAATFETVSQAEATAVAITARIPSSAGIGYGFTLLPHGDLWGVEVNRASRLGEDVAGPGDILLTESALRAR